MLLLTILTMTILTDLILVFPLHRCVLALWNQYFREFCEKNHRHNTRVGFEHNLCNSRAVSYQLDHRDCPVARGSSNPTFYQWVSQQFISNYSTVYSGLSRRKKIPGILLRWDSNTTFAVLEQWLTNSDTNNPVSDNPDNNKPDNDFPNSDSTDNATDNDSCLASSEWSSTSDSSSDGKVIQVRFRNSVILMLFTIILTICFEMFCWQSYSLPAEPGGGESDMGDSSPNSTPPTKRRTDTDSSVDTFDSSASSVSHKYHRPVNMEVSWPSG